MNEQEEVFEPLTEVDDLKRIFFRAQTLDGHWVSIDAASASDAQFDTWIRTRIEVQGNSDPWDLTERLDVCNQLWQSGTLHILKKDIEFEAE